MEQEEMAQEECNIQNIIKHKLQIYQNEKWADRNREAEEDQRIPLPDTINKTIEPRKQAARRVETVSDDRREDAG